MQKFVTTGANTPSGQARRSGKKPKRQRDVNHNDATVATLHPQPSPPPPQRPSHHVLSITVEEGSLTQALRHPPPAAVHNFDDDPPPSLDAVFPAASPPAQAPPPLPPSHPLVELRQPQTHRQPKRQSTDVQSVKMTLGEAGSDGEEDVDSHYMAANAVLPRPAGPSSSAVHPAQSRRVQGEGSEGWRGSWMGQELAAARGRGPGFLPYRDSLSSGPAWTTDLSQHSYRHSDRLIRSKEFGHGKRQVTSLPTSHQRINWNLDILLISHPPFPATRAI